MQNRMFALNMQGEKIILDIPPIIVEKLKYLNIHLVSIADGNAYISVRKYNSKAYKIWIRSNSLITSEIVPVKVILFKLFVEIEDYNIKKKIEHDSSAIALHGGGVIHNGKTVLVLQGKGAGKSTLIAKLVQMSSKYLSDDLLISYGNRVLGIPLPIRLRHLNIVGLEGVKEGKSIEGLDFNNETRYFYTPELENENSDVPISTILIPHYSLNCSNEIVQIKGKEKISIIANQVKRYANMEQLYKNIIAISKEVKVYHLYYKDFSILDSFFSMFL